MATKRLTGTRVIKQLTKEKNKYKNLWLKLSDQTDEELSY